MKEGTIVDIERKAMAHIDALREKRGMSEKDLGELAFPEAKNPRQKVNALRNPRGLKGEPLRIRLGDYCAMCEALGYNPAQELLIVYGKTESD